MPTDPWAFGWNQLFTLCGLLITVAIAIGGYRTFNRWRREQIEERRIDIAFEALSIAAESKTVFGRIRLQRGDEGEWKRMPIREGEPERDRTARGPSYATLVRLNASNDYFQRVLRLHSKAVAGFGPAAERAFSRLSAAHDLVREAAELLTWHIPVRPGTPSDEDFARRMQLRGDLWQGFGPDDRVEQELQLFRSEMEAVFRPVIERKFKGGD